MAVQMCPRGLGEQLRGDVRGIRNAWLRGSIRRGGSTLKASNSGRCRVLTVESSGGSGARCAQFVD